MRKRGEDNFENSYLKTTDALKVKKLKISKGGSLAKSFLPNSKMQKGESRKVSRKKSWKNPWGFRVEGGKRGSPEASDETLVKGEKGFKTTGRMKTWGGEREMERMTGINDLTDSCPLWPKAKSIGFSLTKEPNKLDP